MFTIQKARTKMGRAYPKHVGVAVPAADANHPAKPS
jgi:hypothetical protein